MRLIKVPKKTLILVGLAAFAYYKYSRLSEEQKNTLVYTIKQKFRKFYEEYIPQNIRDLFASEDKFIVYDDNYGEHSDYVF